MTARMKRDPAVGQPACGTKQIDLVQKIWPGVFVRRLAVACGKVVDDAHFISIIRRGAAFWSVVMGFTV